MRRSLTKVELKDAGPPPTFAEQFTWSMDSMTMIVRAKRPCGQTIKCDTMREDRKVAGSRIIATHALSWVEVSNLAVRSKNAMEFIWRLNKETFE